MKKYVFLFAIGTDELPPKILQRLGLNLFDNIKCEFNKNDIQYDLEHWFAAPRHLAIKAEILVKSQIQSDVGQDNYLNNDFIFFNKKNNRDIIYTEKYYDNKLSESQKKSILKNSINRYKELEELLIMIIGNALQKLVNYDMMHWGDVSMPFIRPVHTVTILLDNYLVPGRFFDVDTDRILYGHRYIKNNNIVLRHADDYPEILHKQGYVIVDYDVRRAIICKKIKEQAEKIGGFIDIQTDEMFLNEIVSLIEWPVVLTGKFNKDFLSLPIEIIIYIMKNKHKYFPVYDKISKKILPFFIIVINTITDNYKSIINNHENVIQMSLMDVSFLLTNDSQYNLEEHLPKLNDILFHSKLGSLRNKVNRITELSGWIACKIHANVQQAKRAGYLCKCDLVTQMVIEFPEIQGIVGMYYAKRDGESEEVALAQKEHYQPRFTSDIIPVEIISCIVALADKIDTLSGIFGIGEFPTGKRDPFGLKRSAIGILCIILKRKISLNLLSLIRESVRLYGKTIINTTVIDDVYCFIHKRLYLWYLSQGYRTDIIKSILNIKSDDILQYSGKIHILDDFYKSRKEEIGKLIFVNKRISNFLMKTGKCGDFSIINSTLCQIPEEKQLFEQIMDAKNKIQLLLFDQNSYRDVLSIIINLVELTNSFINKVLIMDQDKIIQNNRLSILNAVKNLILKVLDVSALSM